MASLINFLNRYAFGFLGLVKAYCDFAGRHARHEADLLFLGLRTNDRSRVQPVDQRGFLERRQCSLERSVSVMPRIHTYGQKSPLSGRWRVSGLTRFRAFDFER